VDENDLDHTSKETRWPKTGAGWMRQERDSPARKNRNGEGGDACERTKGRGEGRGAGIEAPARHGGSC
jgi:hypothetical protein